MTDDSVSGDWLPRRAAERYGHLFMWSQSLDLAPRERAVLDHLIAAGDKNLASWWSNEKAAAKIGIGVSTLQRALAELQKAGLISKYERNFGGARSSDRITVLAPAELVDIRLNERERRLDSHEPDIGAFRMPMRPVISTDRMNGSPVKLTDKEPFDQSVDKEFPEGSAVTLTGDFRRRGSGPTPAAAIFEEIRGAA